MSFDARSLERLQQLGRSLPQPLPKPSPATNPDGGRAQARRHRIETEEDPQALFHELMQVSADGQVPPHWLDRLKELESRQKTVHSERRQDGLQPSSPTASTSPSAQTAPSTTGLGKTGLGKTGLGKPNPRLAAEHGELYTAFQQLLLEDDDS